MENLTTYENVYGEKYEKQINAELVLPEYLPGISKVLRVSAIPVVERCEYSDGVDVSGRVSFNVLYESEFDGSLKCTSFSCDFDHRFTKPHREDAGEECFCECTVKSYGESARGFDSRRVSVACTLILDMLVTCVKKCEMLDVPDNGMLKKRTAAAKCMKAVPVSGCDTEIRETVSVPEGMPEIKEIVFCDGEMSVNKATVTENKANVEGKLRYTCMYLTKDSTDSSGYAVFSGDLPFSTSCELEGEIKDSDILCTAHLLRISAEPAVNSYGDSRGCKIEAFGKISGKIFGNTVLSVIEDVFCTKHDCSAEIKELPADEFCTVITSTDTLDEAVRAELGSMTDIVSCSVDVQDVRTEMTGSLLAATCSAVIRILGTNPEHGLEHRSAKLSFRQNHKDASLDAGERYRFDSRAEVRLNEARIENGEVKVSFTSRLSTAVCAEKRVRAVTALEIDDSAEYVRDKSEHVIYYPTEGESVWSVAKRYRTDPEQIVKANGLKSEDRIDKVCVVIPR